MKNYNLRKKAETFQDYWETTNSETFKEFGKSQKKLRNYQENKSWETVK